MADNVLVDNGALSDYTVSADEGSGGLVQRFKLAYASDGSETHVPADADGLLVNLGANNDIQLPGTVEADIGAMRAALVGGGTVLQDPVVNSTGTTVPMRFASVSATADGNNIITTGTTSKVQRILGYVLTATAAGLVTIQDTNATPKVIGRLRIGGDGYGASYAGGIDAPVGDTGSGYGITINCAAGVDVYGHITYILI